MPEAIELVSNMLQRCFPNSKVPNGYIGNIAALMLEYPKSIAVDCLHTTKGIARKSKYAPSVAEIVQWCEADAAFMARVVEREQDIRTQLNERARIEREDKAESPERRGRTVERIRAEMAAAGMPLDDDRKHYHGETPKTVRERYGLSEQQWNELPEGPRSQWRQSQDRMVGR